MAATGVTGLTYDDLFDFPDDNVRREIIDGELFVTPAPALRHQFVSLHLASLLLAFSRENGGYVLHAPTDVKLSEDTVVEPDVLYVSEEHEDRLEEPYVAGAVDLAIEVSSPSTRRTDLHRKRDLYERVGVTEYWFVDLEQDSILVHRAGEGGRYDIVRVQPGEQLTTPLLPGLRIDVSEVFDQPL